MLQFRQKTFHFRIVLPCGETAKRPIEIRTNPNTGRPCRITYSYGEEREPGTGSLPGPPPLAADRDKCPFCSTRLAADTPAASH
jgi:UDPglucose--hexose-1-phosphate uridylyltransferase